MNSDLVILIAEAMAVYFLVLGTHALRRRFGLAHFYALLGGITAVMSWVTDAGVAVNVAGITFMVGSTVFYTSLLLGVFVIYVFDGPHATRIAISTIAGVSVLVPLIAVVLHLQMRLTGQAGLAYVPVPDLRINAASVIATVADLIFLAIAWEFLGRGKLHVGLPLRAFACLLGVMSLDVLLFASGAFLGTPQYLAIMKGTLLSRVIIAVFAWPFLYVYLQWQNRKPGAAIENRPVLAILKDVAHVRGELGLARQEIARRMEAESSLRRSEERFRVLFESSRDAIMTLEPPTWQFTSANAATVNMFGAADERDFTAHEPWALSPARQPDGRASDEKAKAMIETAMREGSNFFEWTHRRIGGEDFPATVLLTRIDIGGKAILQATVRDVTAQAQTTEELRASREKFQSIVDNIGIGVALISPKMEILELNRQMREWFPSVAPGAGTICYAHFNSPPRAQPCTYCPTIKTLQDGRVHEALTETPAGDRVRRYRVVSSPILDPKGQVMAAIEMVEDVTERMEMEVQLKRQQKLASLGTLARGMAHEINNPVMGIVNYAQLILDRLGEESPATEFAAEIGKEAERVAKITHSLLDVTQNQAQQESTTAKPVDIVGPILASATETARQRGVSLSSEIPPDLPPAACRRDRIGTAVMALLTNAMEALDGDRAAGQEEKAIRLTAQRVETGNRERLRLTVSDNGPGIPEAARERLFDPFFTTKDRTQHSGLGLWTCQCIAHDHGGELSVESEVGQWTRFHMDLPAEPEEEGGKS